MPYSQFTLDKVEKQFKLTQVRQRFFQNIETVTLSDWLKTALEKSIEIALISESEKARSEFIIAPILFELQVKNQGKLTLYSGTNFDVDSEQGLFGECDFILTLTPPLQTIHAPIVVLIEAKKQNIEGYLGQCAAQMVGAKLFNEREERNISPIFGCVTTGETWQFLRLEQNTLYIDSMRYYISQVEQILGIFQMIISLEKQNELAGSL